MHGTVTGPACQPGQRYPLIPTHPLQVALQSRTQRNGISWERWELLMLEKEAGMPEVHCTS